MEFLGRCCTDMVKKFSTDAKLFGLDLSSLWQQTKALFDLSAIPYHPDFKVFFSSDVDLYRVETGTWCSYTNGSITHHQGCQYKGVIVPDELVLVKHITLPASLLPDIQQVLSYQLTSLSPFSLDQTVFGYACEKKVDGLSVTLIIASTDHLQKCVDGLPVTIDPHEVWSLVNDSPIRFSSMGFTQRDQSNLQKIKTSASFLLLSVLILLFLPLLPVMAEKKKLDDAQYLLSSYQGQTRDVVQARNRQVELSTHYDLIESSLDRQWLPLTHLNFLTKRFDDNTWLTSFDFSDLTIKIEGRSRDAARLMSDLANSDEYNSVRALAPMVRDASGYERFTIEMHLEVPHRTSVRILGREK